MASLLDPSLSPRYGGAELQMYLLAQEVAKDPSFEVHFVADEVPANSQLPLNIQFHQYPPMIRRGVPGVSAVVNVYRWIAALRATGCDWFVQMSAGTLTAYLAIARTLLGKKFAFWLSSDACVKGELLADNPKALRWYLAGRRGVDQFLTQHVGQQQALKAVGYDSQILRSGFPLPETPAPGSHESVLWVASCQRLKQPGLFIKLASLHPERHFVMVMTPRDEDYFASIKSLAIEVENLELLPGVEDVSPYYLSARVLLNLSTTEGLPNTFIEAGRAGTPVLSLNVDPDGMLSRHGMGYCAAGDFEALDARLSQIMCDDAMWKQASDTAWQYVKQNHDIKQTAATFKTIIAGH